MLIGGWLAGSVVLVAAVVVYGWRDAAWAADVIIVLGAGVNADGTPSRTLEVRSEVGSALYAAGVAPVVICTGGVIGAAPVSEAALCADVLAREGVPREVIFLETDSINTQTNAINAQAMMQANGWQTAVVVSSRYHLLRARWMFARAGVVAQMAPAPIGYLTPGEILFSYFREWAAFHYQVLRDVFRMPHFRVPVP